MAISGLANRAFPREAKKPSTVPPQEREATGVVTLGRGLNPSRGSHQEA
jgi:hypothetical protein